MGSFDRDVGGEMSGGEIAADRVLWSGDWCLPTLLLAQWLWQSISVFKMSFKILFQTWFQVKSAMSINWKLKILRIFPGYLFEIDSIIASFIPDWRSRWPNSGERTTWQRYHYISRIRYFYLWMVTCCESISWPFSLVTLSWNILGRTSLRY